MKATDKAISDLIKKMETAKYEGDMVITDEEIKEWMEKGTAYLQYAKVYNLPIPGQDMLRRLFRREDNMKSPLGNRLQTHLNDLTESLAIQRELLGLTVHDVAEKIVVETESLRWIEKGCTDPKELAGIIEAWADVLGLDGKAFLSAVPGQTPSRDRS